MPFSSMVRIKVASVYRAGGWVKCCAGAKLSSVTLSPSVSSGRGDSFSSLSSSRLSSYTAV